MNILIVYKLYTGGEVSNLSNKKTEDETVSGDKKTILDVTLRKRIINLELAPGAVLDEVSLSQEFGISRSPVREVMRQLAAEGYLELEPNRPARVTAMNYQSLRAFFLAAPLIYIATTQLAVINATDDDIASLKDIQQKFTKAMVENNTEERVYYNDQFHLKIGEIARNPYLIPTLKRLLIDHARLAKTFYKSPDTDEMNHDMSLAVQQHDLIIQAIEFKDVKRAETLINEHWDLSRRRMADYVMPEAIVVSIDI